MTEKPAETIKPKAFVSYSWSSTGHQAKVIDWARRLATEGIEMVMDVFDLREGHDKYAFMERMVTDPTVTHVLVYCDKKYADKADTRKAGVGTESQIISKEVYAKVAQSKFIPIFCEFNEAGEPYVPVFLRSRIGIDFSTEEAVNQNWEKLIRLLYGKPLYEKPVPGKPPAYITEESTTPAGPFVGKLNVFRQAVIHGQRNLKTYRRDFIDSVFAYSDALRTRSEPKQENFAESIVETFRKLVPVRNAIIEWVLLEAESKNDGFEDALVGLLESFLELRGRPKEVNAWNDRWFDAHRLFVYETFLYIIAALLRAEAFELLHTMLFGHYLMPEHERSGNNTFTSFDSFYTYTETINRVLTCEKITYRSQAVELIKRHADRTDIPFRALVEADALCLIASLLQESAEWYPQTFYYIEGSSGLPFFVRVAQHRHFVKLATILGVPTANELRAKITERRQLLEQQRFGRFGVNSLSVFDLEKWDTMK